jgi:hypothetical protein
VSVAIADRRLDDLDARSTSASQTRVRHHRRDHGVALELARLVEVGAMIASILPIDELRATVRDPRCVTVSARPAFALAATAAGARVGRATPALMLVPSVWS